jgi:hypothetical protein
MTKKIQLTRGQIALVDDSDFEELSKYKWCACKHKCGNFIPFAWINKRNTSMHRHLMNNPKGMFVDHINHDTLDNRRSNLRICTKTQNDYNRRKDNKVKYKGIVKDRRPNISKPYRARIMVNKKFRYSCGLETELEAAIEYDKLAIFYFGEFACLNFPDCIIEKETM